MYKANSIILILWMNTCNSEEDKLLILTIILSNISKKKFQLPNNNNINTNIKYMYHTHHKISYMSRATLFVTG